MGTEATVFEVGCGQATKTIVKINPIVLFIGQHPTKKTSHKKQEAENQPPAGVNYASALGIQQANQGFQGFNRPWTGCGHKGVRA
jgi:hypothetical protein